MMPGVTIRKPRVNRLLWGLRTALTVCQAMSIAMTVVFPVPVASLRAIRQISGFADSFPASMYRRYRCPFLVCGATSVSQIAVSTASTWQKNGRIALNA